MEVNIRKKEKVERVMNISWVVQYKKQVREQKVKEMKLIKVDWVKEWKVEKF